MQCYGILKVTFPSVKVWGAQGRMKDFHDLRNYLRLDTSFDVLFKVLQDKGSQNHRGQALDVSAGGVKVFTDRELKSGARLEIYFYINRRDEKKTPISAVGHVIWSREVKVADQGLGRYEVGIRFEEIEPKDRDKIFQYVYKRLAAQERARELFRRVSL